MTTSLKKLFSCCFPKRQISDAVEATGSPRDIIYITVPRKRFLEFLANRPAHWRLDLASFMALYKYTTEDIVANPGPGYTYEKFVFLVDSQYVRVEGWVPLEDISEYFEVAASQCAKRVTSGPSEKLGTNGQNAVCVSGGPSGECVNRGRDIICVDVNGKLSKAKQMVAVQKTVAPAISRQYKKDAISKYSRHMATSYSD